MQRKVLVVDDIPVNCKMLGMQLTKLGIEFDTAQSGQEAVVACMRNRYMIVFMDLDMPEMDGFTATKFIRIHEKPLGLHTPILAVSSFDRMEDRQRCLKEGLDGFLRKGVSTDELSRVIGSYCLEDTGSRFPAVAAQRQEQERMSFEMELRDMERRFTGRTEEIVSDLIFLSRELQPEFEAAITDRNSRKLTHVAYSLKGSCSNAGLNTMANLCAKIADDGYADRWHRVSAGYRRLTRMLELVQDQDARAV